MKNLSLLFLAFLLLQLSTFAQTKWIKYAGNPVLEKGEPGEWDAAGVEQQCVLWDGTKYNMWYRGSNGVVVAIGYATSPDGIHWTKDILNNPVLERGAPGSWDANGVEPGSVLFDGTLYKMWYDGWITAGMTGLATSPDGIHWTKDTINNPVLPTTSGSWDASGAWSALVIFESAIYKMWYNGLSFNNNLGTTVVRLGYADSDSGITWTKHTGPVMEEGDYVTWANDLWNPFVIFEGNNYLMWYVSRNTFSNTGQQINYATSSDGLEWTKDTISNPVLTPTSGSWDGLNIWKPSIIKEDSLYKMWYSGENSQERSIGYAEDFSNLVHAEEVIIEEKYVKPNTDPLNILGRVISPEGHALTAKAFILNENDSIQDSVELFDDGLNGDGEAGDSIYGAYKSVTGENNYTVGIKTVDQVTGFTRNGLDWNITNRFTSIGPVMFEEYVITSNDTVPEPGDQIKFKLKLRNAGITATAVNIKAIISTTDSCISDISDNSLDFGDIPAGESFIPDGPFYNYIIEIDSNCPGEIDIWFNVDIYSNNYLFWSDSFAFHIDKITDVQDEKNSLPDTYALKQNYPNPFNPVTRIEFQIPEISFITLKVYDVIGNEIATLVSEEKPVGSYEIEFDGSELTSGIYFYKLQAGSFVETKKMVLLR